MDIPSISVITSSLKGAVDISKGMLSLQNLNELSSLAVELNSKLIDAQQAIFEINDERHSLLEKIKELENEIATSNNWDLEKVRYQLMSPWPGHPVSVYHLKKTCSNGEEPHWLCPNCFQQSKKSILNTNQNKGDQVHLVCSQCNTKIRTHWNAIDGPQYAEDVKKN